MRQFLERATDFTDIPLLERPDRYMGESAARMVICPLCKGHGYWNLIVDAYGPGKHFKGGCSQCNGWGWVEPENAVCIHEWKEIGREEAAALGQPHYGNCYHVYKCTKPGCNATMAQDSSD